MARAVAKKKPTKVATESEYDFGDDVGGGFEGQSQDDMSIPFLSVLQQLSPTVEEGNGKAGQFLNTVTEEVYDEVNFVAAYTEHVFVEWIPREKGGGIAGIHRPGDDVVVHCQENQEFGKYITPDENDLVETFYVYGVLDDGNTVVIPFTSTKIGVYKRWNTRLKMFTVPGPGGRKVRPPLFSHLNKLTSIKQENPKGKFYNMVISPANGDLRGSMVMPDNDLYVAAKMCKEAVISGTAHADTKSAGKAEDGDTPF